MAIFRPTSSKVSVQKVLLCPFQYKERQSGVSLESPGRENIPQVPRNRSENGQNHNACKAISVSLSVLKCSWAIVRPRSSKVNVQKVLLCPFQYEPRPSGVTLESAGLKIFPKFRETEPKLVKVTMRVTWSRLLFQS